MEITKIPESFATNFEFFVGLLSSEESMHKEPGWDCKYCPITKNDCEERVDIAKEETSMPEVHLCFLCRKPIQILHQDVDYVILNKHEEADEEKWQY